MEKFNRAVRRHHIERLKKKRKHYWGYPRKIHQLGVAPSCDQYMDARNLGKVVQYPQLCSCEGCGNVRRHLWANEGTGLTLQELRWSRQYKEQLEELDTE